jgi:hypothetical protein
LKDDGRLDVRLIPRPIYTQMVKEYRQQPEVISEVFETHFWLWDLEETERALAAEGESVDRGEIAQKMIGEMEDNEWWQVMQSFEAHFQEHFQSCSTRWSALLDPVYDEQESAGWVERQ